MAQRRIYLDFNASAPVRPAARTAMMEAMALAGNPSSVHAEGRAARGLVERAREQVAFLVGARPKDVVFTSGGTEAVNLGLTPRISVGASQPGLDRLFVCATEHACVLQGHRFPAEHVVVLPVGADGVFDLAALDAELERAPGARVMLALQWANNETGVLQPVAAAAARVHAHGGVVLCDAVQGAGRVPVDMSAAGIDLLALSAHKLGGPKGAGALVFAADRLHIHERLMRGGGQERGARAGTENVAAIAGLGAACAAIEDIEGAAMRLAALRDAVEAAVRHVAADVVIFGREAPRLPNTTAFAVPGLSAETLLMGLDLAGVAASSGAACSSGKVARSHVLAAMGAADDLVRGAIRLSLGWCSSEDDVAGFGEAFAAVVGRMRSRRLAAA
jgi:cysteine desulfurase